MSDEEIEELCRTMLNPRVDERKSSTAIEEFFEEETAADQEQIVRRAEMEEDEQDNLNLESDEDCSLSCEREASLCGSTDAKSVADPHAGKSLSEDEACLGKRSVDDSYPTKLAKSHHGRLLKVKRTKSGVKMSFICKLNHRFSLQSSEGD